MNSCICFDKPIQYQQSWPQKLFQIVKLRSNVCSHTITKYALARKNGHREIVSLFMEANKVEKNIIKLIAHERTNKCAG